MLNNPIAKEIAWTDRGCIELKHRSVIPPISEKMQAKFEESYHNLRIKYMTGPVLYDPEISYHELRSMTIPNEIKINIDPNQFTQTGIWHFSCQVPVLIDLRLPLDPQLETIKSALTPLSEMVFGRPYRPAPQDDKFLNYLRILDARISGINYSALGSVLYPEIPNEYPDYGRKKKTQAAYNRAKQYRDCDYKMLLFNAPPDGRWANAKG